MNDREEQVYEALPADNTRVAVPVLLERVELDEPKTWGALALLCSSGRALVWREHGITWARRLAT